MSKIIGAGVLAAFPIIWLIRNSRFATETPRYKIVRTEGAFQLRDYPELSLAKSLIKNGKMNESFGQLFRFIAGKNTRSEKIPMTTPVLIESERKGRTMNFIMPEVSVQKGVPEPSERQVCLQGSEPARFAAMRFSGRRGTAAEKAAADKLLWWMHANGIVAEGEPLFAYYDPPWTPLFLRLNEVIIKVAKDVQGT